MFVRIESALALFACALARDEAADTSRDVDAEFAAFLERNHKSYDDLAEFARRKELWLETDKKITEYNLNSTSTRLGHTKFSDWSSEERAALRNVSVEPAADSSKPRLLSEEVVAGESDGRALTTGDGYAALCNPFLATCTCNAGDFWQLGWCMACMDGCAECTSY